MAPILVPVSPPVLNEANQPIRGLSRRRDIFYARLNLPDLHGRKVQRRITLKAHKLTAHNVKVL